MSWCFIKGAIMSEYLSYDQRLEIETPMKRVVGERHLLIKKSCDA